MPQPLSEFRFRGFLARPPLPIDRPVRASGLNEARKKLEQELRREFRARGIRKPIIGGSLTVDMNPSPARERHWKFVVTGMLLVPLRGVVPFERVVWAKDEAEAWLECLRQLEGNSQVPVTIGEEIQVRRVGLTPPPKPERQKYDLRRFAGRPL